MTRVAVLGTGRMGGAIAHRLVASGFDLQVWDRTAAKASALNVGRVAQTPAEALRDADIVISSLTNAAAVHDVYLGPQGAFGTSTTALFVEMSTAGPESIDELSREARTRGLRLLEAPVLGSVPAVESGTLAVLVGGSRDDLVKDLGLALEVFERTNAAVPLTREARSLFAETASESSDLDISAIVNAYSGGSRSPQNVASLRQAR